MDKLEGVFAIRATKESARECLQEKMCFYTIIKLAIVFFWFVSCFLWFSYFKKYNIFRSNWSFCSSWCQVISWFYKACVLLSCNILACPERSNLKIWNLYNKTRHSYIYVAYSRPNGWTEWAEFFLRHLRVVRGC